VNYRTYTRRLVQSFLQIVKCAYQDGTAVVHKNAPTSEITRRVIRALAPTPRGAVPNDVLAINSLAVGLHVEWFARDVHPWDRDLSEKRKAELFTQQCLEDVDTAIPRLFEQLPEMDVLEIGVLERVSKSKIIAGVVRRCDLDAQVGSSLGMRLKTIGINYRRAELGLEPIS
jgi:hypothetical protein